MIYSTLYAAKRVPVVTLENGETVPDPQHYLCGQLADGSYILHAQPGVRVLDPLFCYASGAAEWTWNEMALTYGTAWSACVTPHEWAGEPTAFDLDPSLFPLLTPPPIEDDVLP